MSTRFLGVDVAKATLSACLWQHDQPHDLGDFANDATGWRARAAALPAEARALKLHLVVEPTGGYEQGLVSFAYEQGWTVSLPNPKQVRDWAKAQGYRAKTDRQDARLLAHFAAVQQPAPQLALPMAVSELDSLLARRRDLEQMLQQERNRLQQLSGRPGQAAAVRPNLEQVIRALEEALAEVQRAIDEQLQAQATLHAEVERLLALPGVGPKVVLPLLVLLYRWQARTAGEGTPKGLTAFVGLDPQPYQSGRTVYKRATISKMGDSEVRRLLYMGVLGALRGNNPLRQFYQQLVGRGKAKKVAIVAAMRKLLLWAWALFNQQTEWDPARHAQIPS